MRIGQDGFGLRDPTGFVKFLSSEGLVGDHVEIGANTVDREHQEIRLLVVGAGLIIWFIGV